MSQTRWAAIAVLFLTVAARGQDPDGGGAKPPKPDFPPWSEVGKDMTESQEGFWNVYQDKKQTKFWVEIPAAHLKKPFLLATSIAGGTTMAGYQWNDWLLVWEVSDKRMVLLERNVGYLGGKDQQLKEAVERTYTDRVLATYRIVAKGPKGGYVLDGESFLASGAPQFFGGIGRSKDASLAKFEAKAFESNTEISVTMPAAGTGDLVTLHYSISRLPSNTGYKPREADTRIGYFITRLKDFSPENKDDDRYLRYINRWQLQKYDPKLELSPPKEPITFYIEKTVPIRFRRYVREGIEAWNAAFEKIGFDNAIVVQQQTETQHAEKDPEDVRYNFFRWIVSDMPFAMGPSRVHPETGQILDADIIFDDSYIRFTLQEYRLQIMQLPTAMTGVRGREMLLHHPLARLGLTPAPDEFFHAVPEDAARPNLSPQMRRAFCSIGNGIRHQLACSCLWLADPDPTPPGDPNKPYPEELIGQFVKDTVMHEVGHTLGLRHNFEASTWRTLDQIHSEEKPGDISASVMDYTPVAIAPEGRPQGNWAMTHIGPYDYWAIEYGYSADDKKLPEIAQRCAEDGLAYATDEDTWSPDPYVDTWDLGKEPLDYAKFRMQLMRKLRKDIERRAVSEGEGYHRLRNAVDMQFYEAGSAARTALRYIGGEMLHRDHRGDPNQRPPLQPVDATKQRAALHFVCDELLSSDYFDLEPELLRKLAPDFWVDDFLSLFFLGHSYPYLDRVLAVQASSVYGLTSPDRLKSLFDLAHKVDPGTDVLTVPEVFDALQKAVFGDLGEVAGRDCSDRQPAIPDARRNLQREYVTQLTWILLEGGDWYPPAIQTLSRVYVMRLSSAIDGCLKDPRAAGLDTYTLSHLMECKARLERALEASYRLAD